MRRPALRGAAVLAIALLLHGRPAVAGHGMLNSFAGIEWLPAPGMVPGDPAYRLDDWQERLRARAARGPAARFAHCLDYAREKLAELRVTVDAGDLPGARRALAAYRDRLDCAAAAAAAAQAALTERLATVLLEHQYIMSTEYMDRPRESRRIIARMIELAGVRFEAAAAGLSRHRRDSLFFKEEEARWSWQTALAADEQGL